MKCHDMSPTDSERFQIIANQYFSESAIDSGASFFLILGSTTVKDSSVPYDGIHGDILCKVWYTKLPLWSLLVSSTWNLVTLTVER